MPKRTYARAFGKSGRFTKRRRTVKARRRPRVPRAIRSRTGFPLQKLVNMKYITTIRLTPALADNHDYFFKANSVYDPDSVVLGHQPYTHDQWQAVYNHYVVQKSSIRLVGTSTTSTPTILGIRITDDTTVEQDIETSMESGKAHYRINASEQSKSLVSHGFNKNKMFRNTGRDGISAQFGSNPSEMAFFHIFARHLNASATGSVIDCLVEINYSVLMWELKDIGQS